MPSTRARKKALDAARPQLHPTSQPLAYGLAVAGPPPMRTVLLLAGAGVAGAVALTALAGGFVGPGWLFFLTFWAFNPPRAVIATSNSVVVMRRSMLNGRPSDVRTVVAVDALLAPPVASSGAWSCYRLGDEVVWMTRKEAATVVDAARSVVAAYAV